MAQYHIWTVDGKTVVLNGPENADVDDVMAQAAKMYGSHLQKTAPAPGEKTVYDWRGMPARLHVPPGATAWDESDIIANSLRNHPEPGASAAYNKEMKDHSTKGDVEDLKDVGRHLESGGENVLKSIMDAVQGKQKPQDKTPWSLVVVK